METPDSKSFPARLKNYRQHNRWTQKQLGDRWSVSPETISAWEHGRRKPDIQLVQTLASDLRMEESQLLAYIGAGSLKLKETRSQEISLIEPGGDGFYIFSNHENCEGYIKEASQHAETIRILTIRGDNYFGGKRGLLYNILGKEHTFVEILVLSPESEHITEKLAGELQHSSGEGIRRRMRISLGNLKALAHEYQNFSVKCYHETPLWKILIFDDIMFVSCYARHVPKNDHNAEMLMIRKGGSFFAGFEACYAMYLKLSSPPE